MARYIDIEEFFKQFSCTSCTDDIIEYLQEIPTADVEEVKHGEWIVIGRTEGNSNILQCSECKKIRRGVGKSAYCRDCGAKMDGGKGSD